MIQFNEVQKSFGEHLAVAPTNLSFMEGMTTVLIGPSGCGKSTVLRLIVGLIEPDMGQVRIDGEALTPENILQCRRKMGYVIQEGGLFPHLTARANVCLMMSHLGRSDDECKQRMHELAELVRIRPSMLDRYPGELSGGQRQRVSLMRALALDPPILLMDEPLAALDPMVRNALQTELRDIFQRLAKTVVFVTHDLAEAAYIGDTLTLMKDGRVIQQGTLDDFRIVPAEPFVTEFLRAQRSPVEL